MRAEPVLPPPPLGDGLTPSLTVMSANAKFLLFYCKTWYSELFKMIATSGFLADLECTKFVFGQGSAPNPTGGATSAPQNL